MHPFTLEKVMPKKLDFENFENSQVLNIHGYWTDSAGSKFGHIYKGIFPYHVRVGEIKNAGNQILTRQINANVSQVNVL